MGIGVVQVGQQEGLLTPLRTKRVEGRSMNHASMLSTVPAENMTVTVLILME